MSPFDGFSSRSTRRKKLDLPEPLAPTRKTNSPLSISRLTLLSAGRGLLVYSLETESKRIMALRA